MNIRLLPTCSSLACVQLPPPLRGRDPSPILALAEGRGYPGYQRFFLACDRELRFVGRRPTRVPKVGKGLLYTVQSSLFQAFITIVGSGAK